MSSNSISGYNDILGAKYIEPVQSKNQNKHTFENTISNRNTGQDTVTISHEAMEKYYSMKNSTASDKTENDNLQSSYKENISESNREDNGAKKYTKMDNSELLAFLQSDTFSEEAMEYVKSVSSENVTNKNDEDSTDDTFIRALDDAKKDETSEENENDIYQQSSNNGGHSDAFIDGKISSKEELSAAISKAQQELKELTVAYQQIMSTDVSADAKTTVAADATVGTAAGVTADVIAKAGENLGEEEKFRLAQPIYKQIQEKLEELQSLRAQAQGVKEAENKSMLR